MELERCWLCAKIVPRATNPPDIAEEDLCQCLHSEEDEVDEALVDAIIERMKEEKLL